MWQRYEPTLDQKSDRHRRAVASYFDRFVLPTLGQRDVHSITRREIVDLLNDVKAKSGPISANRCATSISTWLGFLVRDGVLQSSPASALPRTEEKPRQQILTIPELVRVWRAADTFGVPAGNPVGSFLRLLIALPVRRDEAAGLTHSEVEGEDVAAAVQQE